MYVFYNDVLCEISLSLTPSTIAVVLTTCQQYAVQKVIPTNDWLSRTKINSHTESYTETIKNSYKEYHFLGYNAV